ncbi:MAG TPA: PKD domain-containing protein [Candidatus Thermoplasmatota archaeon]
MPVRLPAGWTGGALLALAALLAGSAAGQPDLVLSVAPTQDLPDGSAVPIAVTLRNLGDTGSPSTTVLIAIDGNPTDPALEFGPVGGGSSATMEAAFTLGCGAHTATALADPEDLIAESDEQNNGATAVVRVVPVPSFTWALAHAPDGHTLALDATGSVGCRPLAFEWTVVPGGAAVGEVVSRSVPAGNLSVTLTVTAVGDPSLRASTTRAVSVNNIPPWVSASLPQAPLPTGSPSGLTVNATDVDGTVESYAIDMGDGFTANSPAEAAQHAYAERGTYTIVVTVRDNLGTENETFLEHTVLNRPPVARIVPAGPTGEVGSPVGFSGLLSSDPEHPDAPSLSYEWSFGDGAVAGGAETEHAYAAPGEFVVTLTVTDGDGGTANATARVTVLPAATGPSAVAELPLALGLVFAGAAGVSFAYARSRASKPSRRTPGALRPGTADPPPPGVPEEE